MTEPQGALQGSDGLSAEGIATAKAVAAQAVDSGGCVDATIDGCRYLVIADVVLPELAANGTEFSEQQLGWWAMNDEGRRAYFLRIPLNIEIAEHFQAQEPRTRGNADG